MSVKIRDYKNVLIVALVCFVLLNMSIAYTFFKKSKDLDACLKSDNIRITSDSLLLAQYVSSQNQLLNVLHIYDSGRNILNKNNDISYAVTELLKSYSDKNDTLKKQLTHLKKSEGRFENQLYLLQSQIDTIEYIKNSLESELLLQKSKYDSIIADLATIRIELDNTNLDTLTFNSPKGIEVSFYGKYNNKNQKKIGVGFYKGKGYYIGEWNENKRDGWGKHFYNDGSYYEGNFQNDLRNGFGTYYVISGEIYKGNWKDDLMEGLGEFITPNGKLLEGVWKAGKLEK